MTSRDQIIAARRSKIAAGLIEYRTFVRANPDNELTPTLAESVASTRARLRKRRDVMRAIGWDEKVTA
jgi:hypothetical protein